MHLLPRGFRLALLLLAVSALAQTPPAADPTKKKVPAEIVPPKAPSTPAPGRLTIETTTPSGPLSPGTKAAVAKAEPPPHPVDALSVPELDQILLTLKQHYVAPEALSDEALKRATVRGLLDRLGAGATVLDAPPSVPQIPSPLKSEAIGDRIAYLRLGLLNSTMLGELDQALDTLLAKSPAACVVDLRAMPPGMDFELAAEVCRRWCPKGKALFTVRSHDAAQEQVFTSKGEPKFHGLLAVLTCAENAGSAEVIAGTLRAQAKAIVIGQRTKGEAASFAELKLASGKLLRYATAEVQLAGGESIVPGGVKPDLAVEMSAPATAEVLRLELEKGTAPLLAEPSRPHMNEAALVSGRNPEIDAAEASQQARGEAKPPPRDAVLERAVDLVTSVAVFERRK